MAGRDDSCTGADEMDADRSGPQDAADKAGARQQQASPQQMSHNSKPQASLLKQFTDLPGLGEPGHHAAWPRKCRVLHR